jgi:hypothetical protein
MADAEKIEGFSDPEMKAVINKLMSGKLSRNSAIYISFILENALYEKNIKDTTDYIGTVGVSHLRRFIEGAVAENRFIKGN